MGLRQTTDEGNLVPVAPPPDADHYDMVLRQIIDEDSLVLFLGSPSGDLAAKLAERFGQKTRQDLPDIAQTIYVTRGRPDLYRALRPILGADREPGLVHRFLARLPRTLEELGLEKRYQLIVSMTFDMALERVFDNEQEPYDLVIYMASGPDKGKFVHFPWEGSPQPIVSPNSYAKLPIGVDYEIARTLIVKPYGAADGSVGNYSWKENYVLTREEYLNYLSGSPIEGIFPVQILDKLRDSHCLFLDCPARDWWQHILLTRVWEGTLGARSWAVEPDADQFEMNSWARANVDLYTADPAQYVDQLQGRLSLLNRAYRPPAQSSSVGKRQLKIFINYRHADTQGTAWALCMKLEERFGAENVFFDHGSLRPEMQWFDEIKSHMTVDSAFLVLIGPQWMSILTKLHQTGDVDRVAKEIDLALRSGPGITVIPVLVDSGEMPDRSEVPPSLRALLSCQAERLRPNNLLDDIEHLSDRLSEIHET